MKKFNPQLERGSLYGAIMLLFVLVMFLGFKNCTGNREREVIQSNYNTINDSAKIWRKNKKLYSEKKTLSYTSPEDFLLIKTQEKDIIELQKLVKEYKSKIKNNGSISHIKGETIIDTSYTKIPNSLYFYKDSIKNKWIDFKYHLTRKGKDSVYFKLKMKYEYAVILKEEKQGWFKKPVPYAEVVNYNPYSYSISTTTFKIIKDVRSKRFVIGPNFSYGIGKDFTPQGFVGVGVTYKLIQF